MTTGDSSQKLLRANMWSDVFRPRPDSWTPTKRVSVVIPAWRPDYRLSLTLASLAAQSYPQHLLEVLVVDDGNEEPVVLPSLIPGNTKIVRVENGSWGRANALKVGFESAQGDVFFCMDADVIPSRDHILDNLWVFDLIPNAATKGDISFVAEWSKDPAEVYTAVQNGDYDRIIGQERAVAQWIEDRYERSDLLNHFFEDIFGSYTGGTCAVSRQIYERIGGLDGSLKLGEDIDFGYRIAQAGAVFVPVRTAPLFHLGPATSQVRSKEVNRFNDAYFAQRIPQLYNRRVGRYQRWAVPTFRVSITVADRNCEAVEHQLNSLLSGKFQDFIIDLIAPWHLVTDDRRSPLNDNLELHLIHERFRSDPRVFFSEEASLSAFPSPFRIVADPTVTFGPQTLTKVLDLMRSMSLGQLFIPIQSHDSDEHSVQVLRTAAIERLTGAGLQGAEIDTAKINMVWPVWFGYYPDFEVSVQPANGDTYSPPTLISSSIKTQKSDPSEVKQGTKKKDPKKPEKLRKPTTITGQELLPRGQKANLRLLFRVIKHQFRLAFKKLR